MNVSIVILWYLRWWIIFFWHQSFRISLYLWWSLTLGIIVMKMCLLLSGLAHQRVSLIGLRNRVFILENDWDASSFGFESLVQSTLGIKLMIHITISWSNSVWRSIRHRSRYSPYSSVTTRSICSWKVSSESLLKLAVNIDNIFILVKLVFSILSLWILVSIWVLRAT